VFVRITEHKPLALWQRDGALALINVRGEVIPAKIDDFGYLPLVVGDDAAAHATQLLSLVAAFPVVADQLEAAVRISGRRWNLRLKGKIEVRLPETEVAVALARLAELQQSQGLLQRDVVAVDLRLPDRLIVQTNSDEIVPAGGTGEDT
ncbi:MAG: cell division protein FtsQ/DivIB, partial [Alphaproteobacteria bacterium]